MVLFLQFKRKEMCVKFRHDISKLERAEDKSNLLHWAKKLGNIYKKNLLLDITCPLRCNLKVLRTIYNNEFGSLMILILTISDGHMELNFFKSSF